MEPTEVIVASLVLGYLKAQKCNSAYREFLRNSRQLQNEISKNQFFPTRYKGLTLNDVLTEYFKIDKVVQGKLEATNYYEECHSKSSLLTQLLYLLNKVHCSRTSTPTPCPSLGRSPTSIFDQTSPIDISDVEATPAHSLPGNVKSASEDYFKKSTEKARPTDKRQTKHCHVAENEDMSEVLTQTLLENKEFHEKIAQTINKVAEKQLRGELDKTIKTVVKKTEEDPIFDQILEEIIESTALSENCKTSAAAETSRSLFSHQYISNESTKSKSDKTSSKQAEKYNSFPSSNVDHQNEEAVQSIVTTSKFQTVNAATDNDQGNNEIILFDGTLDHYLQSNVCGGISHGQPAQNSLYVNTTGGLLLVPPASGGKLNVSGNLYMVPSTTPPISDITQDDILKMPTVIVTDDHDVNVSKIKGKVKEVTAHDESETSKPKTPKSTRKENATRKISLQNANVCSSDRKLNEEIFFTTTPPPLQLIQKFTPKSSSHIRNLDFSSPPKITSTNKKCVRPNKGNNNLKKYGAKMLFVAKKTEAKRLQSWDSDLRSILPPADNLDSSMRKKCKNEKSSRAKKKKTCKRTINTTEQEGAAIEAALKTPVKENSGAVGTNEKKPHDSPELSEDCEVKCMVTRAKAKEKKQRKSKENLKEALDKTVLSPSRLNSVNKRNIMDESETAGLAGNNLSGIKNEEEDPNKFITPETVNDNPARYAMKANRNISKMLETPSKKAEDSLPPTPGIRDSPGDFDLSTASNVVTPFTKMLQANLKSIDINSIPTPNLPITPGFPSLTPSLDLISPYPNRPTDYSTSSSYYQPSDSEQNRSLETNIMEMEKNNKIQIISDVVIEPRKPPEAESVKENPLNQHLNMFNKGVIGKKNLSLMKKVLSSSCSESSSDEDASWNEKESNDTIIFRSKPPETPRRTYSLRTRSATASCGKVESKIVSERVTAIVHSQRLSVDNQLTVDSTVADETNETGNKEKSANDNKKVWNKTSREVNVSQKIVLQELEAKRQRTIGKIKNKDQKVPRKAPQTSRTFMKIKPLANLTNSKKKIQKSPKNQRKVQEKKEIDIIKDTDSDKDCTTRKSDKKDEAMNKKVEAIEEKSGNTETDLEAQNLIEGLKERGIHLMQNKCPVEKSFSDRQRSEKKVIVQDVKNQDLEAGKNNEGDSRKEIDFPKKVENATCVQTKLDYSFDHDNIEEYECVSFNESKLRTKSYKDYDFGIWLKPIVGKVFIEEINDEVDVPVGPTKVFSLLEISPLSNKKKKEQKIKQFENVSQKCETKELEAHDKSEEAKKTVSNVLTSEPESPKSTRKRKCQSEESSCSEKKCKTLLKKINVDSFLNNIHGGF